MKKIDLNCDMGESYGKNSSGNDAAIMPYISSCNVACGFHSGDPSAIARTIKLALENEVAVGAHPSYPDLQGFGRRVMNLKGEDLQHCILYQISAIKGMTEAFGGKLHHVKPHGALYNYAFKDEETAKDIVKTMIKTDPNLTLYAPDRSILADVARAYDIRLKSEVFADRRYNEDLSLQSRSVEGAVLHKEEEVLKQLESMILNGEVVTSVGTKIPIKAETVCLHSDTRGSEDLAKKIYEFLKANDYQITSDQ